ncbi:MAG: DUF763 domain-containing protein [Polyangia bacterium]
MRTGTADLPLHGGRVPMWLARRMAELGRIMVEALTLEYGRDEVLRRLADPFWFQALGCVMGMDWHSSGITTSVLGALKHGLAEVEAELGIHVCGGRGRHARRTPDELRALGERASVDVDGLVRASRLVAKVDSAAVQDGFALYLHGFIVSDDGHWVVVQQGMNPERRQARRYHWLWDRAGSFVDQPHAAIAGLPGALPIINLTDHGAEAARRQTLSLALSDPGQVVAQVERVLAMPSHHDVRADNLDLRRLQAALHVVASQGPESFPELLLTPKLGQRTLFALALVAEVLRGTRSRFADPARFAFAHGGKDGHPFPVPLKVYDATLQTLRRAVGSAKLGQGDKLAALRRLDAQCRLAEAVAGDSRLPESCPSPSPLPAIVAHERHVSADLGGRTVSGHRPRQLSLGFGLGDRAR